MDANLIRKIRILNALQVQNEWKQNDHFDTVESERHLGNTHTKNESSFGFKHSLAVDDIHSLINKATAGKNVEEPAALTYDMRFKRIDAWTRARDFFTAKLFEDVKHDLLSEFPFTNALVAQIEKDFRTTMLIDNSKEATKTPSPPHSRKTSTLTTPSSNTSNLSESTKSPNSTASSTNTTKSSTSLISSSSSSKSQYINSSECVDFTEMMYPDCVLDLTTTSPEKPTIPYHVQSLLNINQGDLVLLGPNGTTVSKEFLTDLDWSLPYTYITRKLLLEIFEHEILATHTLSGRPSPAFKNVHKPKKLQIDPKKINDITYFLTNTTGASKKEIRHVVTLKCSEETRAYRSRQKHSEKVKANRKLKLADIKSNDVEFGVFQTEPIDLSLK